MIKRIIGGVIVVVVGGTFFAIHQSDVTKNFAQNTGETQQQAQQFINNIPKSDLESFTQVGQGLVSDGNSGLSGASGLDCNNYTYNKWQTPYLSCADGKDQLQQVSNDEVTLGNCYEALGTDLGNAATSKINECITDSDTVNTDYSMPIVSAVLDSNTIANQKKTIEYDKSILQAALQSK